MERKLGVYCASSAGVASGVSVTSSGERAAEACGVRSAARLGQRVRRTRQVPTAGARWRVFGRTGPDLRGESRFNGIRIGGL